MIYVRPQGLLNDNGREGGGGRGLQCEDKKSQSGDKTGDMWSIMCGSLVTLGVSPSQSQWSASPGLSYQLRPSSQGCNMGPVVLLLVLHQAHLSYQQVSLWSGPLQPPRYNSVTLPDPLRPPGQQHEVSHNARQGFPQHWGCSWCDIRRVPGSETAGTQDTSSTASSYTKETVSYTQETFTTVSHTKETTTTFSHTEETPASSSSSSTDIPRAAQK